MKVNELVSELDLKVVCAGANPERVIEGGYTSDLLSDVMGNIEEGMVWITLQTHRNVIAVAALKEVAAVILVGGATLDDENRSQAEKEGVCILSTDRPSFEISGLLYAALNR